MGGAPARYGLGALSVLRVLKSIGWGKTHGGITPVCSAPLRRTGFCTSARSVSYLCGNANVSVRLPFPLHDQSGKETERERRSQRSCD